MAYFLKKTKLKGRTYLSIVESFYSPEKKGTAHRVYKSLQSLETLVGQGLEDPIAYYQKEVDELNRDKSQDKQIEISEQSPKRCLGYFPLKAIMKKLRIQHFVNLFKLTTDFDFDLYEILSSLVYARCVNPCSKLRTFHDVLPCLDEGCHFSYDQLLRGLDFYGNNYEKFVELFTTQVSETFGLNTNSTYFDCTNFYFEIDREDDFRRKGPSKENRKEPIVGLGLLLDANQIPIGMRMFPGNESEKPVIREVIGDLKKQNNITGKTIQVADKGLNCSENIITARKNGDGYIFSKSVKQLSGKEMVWVELDRDWHEVKDKEGRPLYKYKECVDGFPYTHVDENGKALKVQVKEKRVLTYNPSLAEKQKFEIRKMAEKVKDLCHSKAKRAEYGDYGKYVTFRSKSSDELAIATVNQEAIDNDLRYVGLNMVVTSEVSMSAPDIYSTYRNLWRIEESFRIMKSDLDARPVFLQKENTIKGHFLICYIAVLLERILQFRILGNKYCSSEIYQFFKDFIVVKGENRSINLTSKTDFITALAKETGLPLLHLNLTDSQVKKIMNWSV